MIADLKPYAKCRESGLPWLNGLPEAWQLLRCKSVFDRVDVRSKTGQEELLTVSASHGVVPRKNTSVTMFKAKSYIGHKLCWPGDIVVNSLWAWMQGLGVARHHGLISSAYSVYRPRQSYENYGSFFHYLLRSDVYKWELQTRSKGVWLSRLQLSDLAFMDMPIPLPPSDEQAAIVRFLDHVNRRLEKTIRAKRKLIALLNEQKQIIIHRAVTRGLDPTVPLKDSGIPWLGEIPDHWNEISVGAATNLIQTGPFGSQLHSHEYVTGGIPVINPSHMKDGRVIPDASVSISPSKIKELERHKVQIGDIIAARRGELGRCAIVTPIEVGWLCGTGSLLIRCKQILFSSTFFQMVFASQGIRDSLSLASIGATMDNLNAGMVARLRMPLPSITEQNQIVEFVRNENQRHEIITSAIQREIALLREYRTRLIADVVTGKLDVREAAARVPEEGEELEESPIMEEEEEVTDDL